MDETDHNLDRAIAERLAKLRSMPIEVCQLEGRLKAVLPALRRRPRAFSWRPATMALAAGITFVALMLGVLFALLAQPQTVSAGDLARIHREVLAEKPAAQRVSTTEEVNQVLHSVWPQAPVMTAVGLPVRSCCVHAVGRKRMACMSLLLNGQPVTAAVGRASEIRVADWPTTARDGVPFCCYSAPIGSDGVNAVAMERNGILILVFGTQPTGELLDAIDQVRL